MKDEPTGKPPWVTEDIDTVAYGLAVRLSSDNRGTTPEEWQALPNNRRYLYWICARQAIEVVDELRTRRPRPS